ncbi:MAG: hypothetical protein RI897_1956 [Verrucomicrobiota bacterium]|jgi:prepilin-type N-terminal cleavage/methylation domain-containing protein
MTRSQPANRDPLTPAFTLIELIAVLALLATLMAVVAPRLAGSMRRRNLQQEAARLVALSEYGRDQAIARGAPMIVWMDQETSWIGLQPKPGFPTNNTPNLEFQLPDDLQIQVGTRPGNFQSSPSQLLTLMEFSPEGNVELQSAQTILLQDKSGSTAFVTLKTNGWGYETLTEQDYELRLRQLPQ